MTKAIKDLERSLYRKLKGLERKRRRIGDDVRHAYAVAREAGIDTVAMRQVIREQFEDPKKVAARQRKVQRYRAAAK